MLTILFPFKIQLTILQLFEYNLADFCRWIFGHFFCRQLEGKKKLIWTGKSLAIYWLSLVYCLSVLMVLLIFGHWLGLILGLLLASQSYFYLILALLTIWPLDYYLKERSKSACRQKIETFKKDGLKVIGITGSFGKTTTKEFLYQIMRQKYQVLRTPESFNTVLGIAKVVEWELDENYQYFICEYGAFKKGSIKELVEMVRPDFGVLIGINEQHLEQIGSIEDIIREKFTVVESIDVKSPIVINIDNKYIADHYQKYDRNYIGYGLSSSKFKIQNSKFNANGSNFDLILDGKKYPAQVPVFGQSNLLDILAAATMAFQLDIEPQTICETLKTIKPVAHRLEVKQFANGTTYIDNAFSSNVDGFKLALDFLKTFEKRPKILITPGIVLLADRSADIHRELGLIAAKICDKVILVGQNERTESLAEGINDDKKIIFIEKIVDALPQVEILHLKNPVVLIENDLPDNY